MFEYHFISPSVPGGYSEECLLVYAFLPAEATSKQYGSSQALHSRRAMSSTTRSVPLAGKLWMTWILPRLSSPHHKVHILTRYFQWLTWGETIVQVWEHHRITSPTDYKPTTAVLARKAVLTQVHPLFSLQWFYLNLSLFLNMLQS